MRSVRDTWLRWSGKRRLPVIRQSTVAECGLACLAMLAAYFGCDADLVSLRRRFGASLKGTSLDSMMRVSTAIGLTTRAVQCELDEMRRLRTPCILHWGLNHFVVLAGVGRRGLHLHDPARGRVVVGPDEADRKFTGIALELMPAPEFRRRRPLRRLRLADLIDIDRGLATTIGVALLFALFSELLLLAAPFYLQIVIDQVLLRGDHGLLGALAAGFAMLAVFQVVAGTMRQLTTQFVSQTTVFSLSSRVLRHLLHLPASWFRGRSLGDMQQRVQSLGTIQAFVTEAAPALVLDAFFLVLVSVLMFAYAPSLTLLVFAAAGLYIAWRALIFRTMLDRADSLLRTEAAAQTHLLESLRAAQSIKLLAGEPQRLLGWQDRFAGRINAQIRMGNLRIADGAVHQTVFQGLHLSMVALLAVGVMHGDMSVGMLSAFAAYTGMFVTRVGGVVNRVFDYLLLRVPLDRLADIVLNEAETPGEPAGELPKLRGNLRLNGLSFVYPGERQAIIRDLTLQVGDAEFVAVVGHSGCGKSTLLRILAGVETPTAGEFYVDDRPAADWPSAVLRRQTGTVFQDDALVAGSIEDNIALFDPDPDPANVRRAAELAFVDGDIEDLPMGYRTRIGDLGSALSAGQAQRILFARALYRRPRLLLLDEFTSGLDENTERLVVATLQRLRVTRVVVTHSPIVMRAADRVVDLAGTLSSGTPVARLSAGSGP